jgi:hypothetical protein
MNHRRNGGVIVAFVFASSAGNHLGWSSFCLLLQAWLTWSFNEDTCLGDNHAVHIQHDING